MPDFDSMIGTSSDVSDLFKDNQNLLQMGNQEKLERVFRFELI